MNAYEELLTRVEETSVLRSTMGVLGWDQRTKMPPGGVELRSRQLAQLARLGHERATDPRIGELLAECESDDDLTSDPHSDSGANIREIRRAYDRQTKLPSDLVEERARTSTIAEHHWEEAREKTDFSIFAPWLEKNIDLSRRTAEYYGWESDEEPWDALAEGFERGMRAKDIEAVFIPLRDRLQALVSELTSTSAKPSTRIRDVKLPIDAQMAFVTKIAEAIGFDFSRGRIDTTVHPFCSGFSPGDVRITTRFSEHKFFDALAATMHETGHGIYEQGLPAGLNLQPIGRAVSLGFHESQSRMWENFVGRSLAFWRWCQPMVAKDLGTSEIDADEIYAGMNVVAPDFIRVEADEATYNLHIMVRFELERSLMNGDISAPDVPHEWNRRYKEYLGIDVPNDTLGCLQDVHWSGASFGYFPTYTLGNLYAAQIFEKIREDIPDIDARFERGEFATLKAWLNENLHTHGSRYEPADLCMRLTGKPLSADPLLRHLEAKLRPLYGL
ncbi:MAG: carboxypeptidase M32 [Actinobacteria bacterium]|nr:carboxypeptidase M32 [Actinomycetota bacterium]